MQKKEVKGVDLFFPDFYECRFFDNLCRNFEQAENKADPLIFRPHHYIGFSPAGMG